MSPSPTEVRLLSEVVVDVQANEPNIRMGEMWDDVGSGLFVEDDDEEDEEE